MFSEIIFAEPMQPSASLSSTKHVRYWSQYLLLQNLQEQIPQETLQDFLSNLENNEYSSLGIEQKFRVQVGGRSWVMYSARITQAARILFMPLEGTILILDYLPNHEYDASKFMKRDYFSKFAQSFAREEGGRIEIEEEANAQQEDFYADLHHLKDIDANWRLTWSDKGSFVILNERQEQVYSTPLPAVCSGLPGVGKSVVLIDCLYTAVERFKASEDAPRARFAYISKGDEVVARERKRYLEQPFSTREDCQADFILAKDWYRDPATWTITQIESWIERNKRSYSALKDWACAQIFQELTFIHALNKNFSMYISLRGRLIDDPSIQQALKSFYENFNETILAPNASVEGFKWPAQEQDLAEDILYDSVYIDEAQNFTVNELLYYLIQRSKDGRVLFAQDVEQTLSFKGSDLFQVLRAIYHRLQNQRGVSGRANIATIYLQRSYRCLPNIASLGSKLLATKRAVLQGEVSRGGDRSMQRQEDSWVGSSVGSDPELAMDPKNGDVRWLQSQDDLDAVRSYLPENAYEWAVLVRTPGDLATARNIFGEDVLILLVTQAQGIEFKLVLFFNPCDYSLIQEAYQEIQDRDSGVEKLKAGSTAMNAAQLSFSSWIGEVFTGVTRAREGIWVLDMISGKLTAGQKAFCKDINRSAYIQNAKNPCEIVFSATTLHGWSRMIATFIESQQWELAEKLYNRNMKEQTTISFEQWCSEQGLMQKRDSILCLDVQNLGASKGAVSVNAGRSGQSDLLKPAAIPAVESRMHHDKIMKAHKMLDQNDRKKPKDFSDSLKSAEWTPLALHQIFFQESASPKKTGFWQGMSLFWAIQAKPSLKDAIQNKIFHIKRMSDLLSEEFFSLPAPQSLTQGDGRDLRNFLDFDSEIGIIPETLMALTLCALNHPDMWSLIIQPLFEKMHIQTRRNLWRKCRSLEEHVSSQEGAVAASLAHLFGFSMLKSSSDRITAAVPSGLAGISSKAEKAFPNQYRGGDLDDPLLPITKLLKIIKSEKTSWNTWKIDIRYKDLSTADLATLVKKSWKNCMRIGIEHFYREPSSKKVDWLANMNIFWGQIFAEGELSHNPCRIEEAFFELLHEMLMDKASFGMAYAYFLESSVLSFMRSDWQCDPSRFSIPHAFISNPASKESVTVEERTSLFSSAGLNAHVRNDSHSISVFKDLLDDNKQDLSYLDSREIFDNPLEAALKYNCPRTFSIFIEHMQQPDGAGGIVFSPLYALTILHRVIDALIDGVSLLEKYRKKNPEKGSTADSYQFVNPWRVVLRSLLFSLEEASVDQWITARGNTIFHLAAWFSTGSNPEKENGARNGYILEELFDVYKKSAKKADIKFDGPEIRAYKSLLSLPRRVSIYDERSHNESEMFAPFSSPLCLSIFNINTRRMLLHAGAPIVMVGDGQNPIEHAVAENASAALKDFVTEKEKKDAVRAYFRPFTKSAFSLAMLALQRGGDEEIFNILEQAGIDFSLPEKIGSHTPLIALSLMRLSHNAKVLIRRLRSKGGEAAESIRAISLSGGVRVTALTYAAEAGEYALMGELIHAGCDPLMEEEISGQNVLLMALLNHKVLPAQRVFNLVIQFLEKSFETNRERVLDYINQICMHSETETTVLIEAIRAEKYRIAIQLVALGADCTVLNRKAFETLSLKGLSGEGMLIAGDLGQKMLESPSMLKAPLIKGPFFMPGELDLGAGFETHLIQTALKSQNYFVAEKLIAHGLQCCWNLDGKDDISNVLIDSMSPNLPVVVAILDRLHQERENGGLSDQQVCIMINAKNAQGETVWDLVFEQELTNGSDSRYAECLGKGIELGANLWERDPKGIPRFFHLMERDPGSNLLRALIEREIRDGKESQLRENFAACTKQGVSALEWLFGNHRAREREEISFHSGSKQRDACGFILLEYCDFSVRELGLVEMAIQDKREALALGLLEKIALKEGGSLIELLQKELAMDCRESMGILRRVLGKAIFYNCGSVSRFLCDLAKASDIDVFSDLMNLLATFMSDFSMAEAITFSRNTIGSLLGSELELYIQKVRINMELRERDLVAFCLRNQYFLTLKALIESKVSVLDKLYLSEDLFAFCLNAKTIGTSQLAVLSVLVEHAISQRRLRDFLFAGEASKKDIWGFLWEQSFSMIPQISGLSQDALLRSLGCLENYDGLLVRSPQKGVLSTAFAKRPAFFEKVVRILSGSPCFMKMTMEKSENGETVWDQVMGSRAYSEAEQEGFVDLLLEACIITKSDREDLAALKGLIRLALRYSLGSFAVRCFDKWSAIARERYLPEVPREASENLLSEAGELDVCSSRPGTGVQGDQETDLKVYFFNTDVDVEALEYIFDIETNEEGSAEMRDLSQRRICAGIVRNAIDRGQIYTLGVCKDILSALGNLKKSRGFEMSFTYTDLVLEYVRESMEKSERDKKEDFLFGHARLLKFFSINGISFEPLGTNALALATEFQNWDVLMVLMENFGSAGALLLSHSGAQNLSGFIDLEVYNKPGVETLMRLVSWKQERAGHGIENYKQCKNFISMQCGQKYKQAGMPGVAEFLEAYAVGEDKKSIAEELATCFNPESNMLSPISAGTKIFPLTTFDLTKWARERSIREVRYHQTKEYPGGNMAIRRAYAWDKILNHVVSYSSLNRRGRVIPVKSICDRWNWIIAMDQESRARISPFEEGDLRCIEKTIPQISTDEDVFASQIMDKQFSIFCALMGIENSSWTIPDHWKEIGELRARANLGALAQKPRVGLQDILQKYLGEGIDSESSVVKWMRLYSRLQGVVLFKPGSNLWEMSVNEKKERFHVLLAFAKMCSPALTEHGQEWPLFMALMDAQGVEGIYSRALLVVEECLVREIVTKLAGDKREDAAYLIPIALKTLCIDSLIAYKMRAKAELNRAETFGYGACKTADLYRQYESDRESFVTLFYPHLREIYLVGASEEENMGDPLLPRANLLTFSSASSGMQVDTKKDEKARPPGKKK